MKSTSPAQTLPKESPDVAPPPQSVPQAGSAARGAPPRSRPATADKTAGSVWVTGLEPEVTPLVEQIAAIVGDGALAKLGMFRLPAGFKLSVVMPVFNERKTIEEIIRRVRAVPIAKEIVLVDDFSTDGTRQRLGQLEHADDLRVFYHDRNRGKGAALQTALSKVQGDVVLIQDADLEYDPADYPRLIRPLIENQADVVYGSRYLGRTPGGQSRAHRLANKLLTGLSNRLTRLNLTDMETCYKVFRSSVLDDIRIVQQRFGVEPELTAKFARRKLRIVEVPVSYAGRNKAEGKKIGLSDAFNALYCIVRYSIAE